MDRFHSIIHIVITSMIYLGNLHDVTDGACPVEFSNYPELGCFPVRKECGECRAWYCIDTPYPESPAEINTHFFLYTSDVLGHPITYNTAKPGLENYGFDSSRKTKIIIHGFTDSAEDVKITPIRDALFEKDSFNIIMVDWQNGADVEFNWYDLLQTYRRPVQNARVVAKQLYLLMKQLHNEVDMDYGDVHVIGHSLGAQIAGQAAAYLDGQIGRITGLDPAKPLYEGKDPVCRLDKSDARFVDVIHTDPDLFGTDEESGDDDFWPNESTNQPGCENPFEILFDPFDNVDLATRLACNHRRATEFYTQSIRGSCDFKSHPCLLRESSCDTDCPKLGFGAEKTSRGGNSCLEIVDVQPNC